jgi:hypothetical protein
VACEVKMARGGKACGEVLIMAEAGAERGLTSAAHRP